MTTHTVLLLCVSAPGRTPAADNYFKEYVISPIVEYFTTLKVEVVVLTITEELTIEQLHTAIDKADSMILPGGEDVTPATYDMLTPTDPTKAYTEIGDRYQIEAIHYAVNQGKRLFGICRGIQITNVAYGGTLHQHFLGHHIPNEQPDYGNHLTPIELHSTNPQLSTFKTVHCSHHQGIDRLGEGLTVTGSAPDGMIESVEHENGLVRAYQFHPEARKVLKTQFKTVSDFLLHKE